MLHIENEKRGNPRSIINDYENETRLIETFLWSKIVGCFLDGKVYNLITFIEMLGFGRKQNSKSRMFQVLLLSVYTN